MPRNALLFVWIKSPQANYYHPPGSPQGKVLIFLQGGGACDSVESCRERCAHTNLCTAQTDQAKLFISPQNVVLFCSLTLH